MNNQTIQSLVDEALEKLACYYPLAKHDQRFKDILTTLATKASENGLKPLSEVDELANYIYLNSGSFGLNGCKDIAEKIIMKYGTPPSAWWMNLKEGDKFLLENEDGFEEKTFRGGIYLTAENSPICNVSYCQPYTPPSPLQQFMDSLTPEQKELAKGLRIQEGE